MAAHNAGLRSTLTLAATESGGGHRFVIPESAAKQATYFKDALEGWQEGSSRVYHLTDYSADIVELVCRYLVWRERYSQAPVGSDIPDFADQVPTESALLLLMCADYLGC